MYILSIHSVIPSSKDPSQLAGKMYLEMAEQDFSDLFERNEMRRLSKLIKNGIGCGLRVLKNSDQHKLDAIITGTGKGSISKIEQFLSDIDNYKETALNPSIFIQSTHNTINGQIALKTGSNTYNVTHVNQGMTLSNVLSDAELFLLQHPDALILVGVFEENTEFNIEIHNSAGLSGIESDGSYQIKWGESVTFFILSGKSTPGKVKITSSKTYTNFNDSNHWESLIKDIKLDTSKINNTAFLLGHNNAIELNSYYVDIIKYLNESKIPFKGFKEVTGEHDTAGGYAIDLANQILTNEVTFNEMFQTENVQKIIIINHFKDYMCHVLTLELAD